MGIFFKSKKEKIEELKEIINRIINLSKQNPYITEKGFQVEILNNNFEVFINSKLVFFYGNGKTILPDFFEKRKIIKELKKIIKESWENERVTA